MRLLRSALFNLAFFGLTAGAAVLALPLLVAPRAWTGWALRTWARLAVWLLRRICGVRVTVTGREFLPAEGPALIAAKHQSAFDTIVWFTLVPDAVYVLKRELFWIPLYGWHARRAGMIGVDRGAGSTAMRGLLREAKQAVAAGRQIVIFPEGTRVPPGERVPYQPGIVALSAATGLPVFPVATNSGHIWGRRAFHKNPGEIHIAILPPLPPRLGREALLGALETRIEDAQARL